MDKAEPPLTTEQADAFLTYLILGVILGGRLGYVLFYNLNYYAKKIHLIFYMGWRGMSFHGGFLGVIIIIAHLQFS